MRRRLALAAAAPLVALGVAAVLGWARDAPGPAACRGAAPSGIVRSYYAAINRGDAASARACFTAAALERLGGAAPGGAFTRVELRRVVETPVDGGTPPNRLPRPAHATIVWVQYDAQVHPLRLGLDESGPGARFFYVVQETDGAPWRIATVGAGP
jgi:hypothetical protein